MLAKAAVMVPTMKIRNPFAFNELELCGGSILLLSAWPAFVAGFAASGEDRFLTTQSSS